LTSRPYPKEKKKKKQQSRQGTVELTEKVASDADPFSDGTMMTQKSNEMSH